MKNAATKKPMASFAQPLTAVAAAVLVVLFSPCSPGSRASRGPQEMQSLLQPVIGSEPNAQFLSQESIEGDWVVEADIARASDPPGAAFLFPFRPGRESFVALHLYPDRVSLICHVKSGAKALSSFQGVGVPPWRLKVMTRGAYYIFHVHGSYLGFTFRSSKRSVISNCACLKNVVS
jgi:hypothetical protein